MSPEAGKRFEFRAWRRRWLAAATTTLNAPAAVLGGGVSQTNENRGRGVRHSRLVRGGYAGQDS